MEKSAYKKSVDRISQLPESLICEILSWLPIRDSIATCFLSRSWRHRWKDLQAFNFSTLPFLNHNGFLDYQGRRRFFAFVNRVLLHHRRATVRKLRIRYHKFLLKFDDDPLRAWVYAAIGSHLEELKFESEEGWEFKVPSGLFTCCTSLVSLELGFYIDAEKVTKVRFPSLKNLKMGFCNTNLVTTILSGSPILETLDLRVATGLHVFKIHSPSLKRLYFCDFRSVRTELLEINTPLLEYLSLRICGPQYQLISVCNSHNFVEANIDCNASEAYVHKLLKSLCEVKSSLVLHPNTTDCLVHATQFDLPEFRYLLNLEFLDVNLNKRFLFRMLERCPMLQVLTIHQAWGAWTKPTNVPYCLASQLSIVNFKTYHGDKDDQELIAYILQEGLALKSISIGLGFLHLHPDSDKKERMINELSHLPKGSKMCQLYFK